MYIIGIRFSVSRGYNRNMIRVYVYVCLYGRRLYLDLQERSKNACERPLFLSRLLFSKTSQHKHCRYCIARIMLILTARVSDRRCTSTKVVMHLPIPRPFSGGIRNKRGV